MGTIDRVVRIVFALCIAVIFFTGHITGSLIIILLVLSAIFLLTSFISFCPLYTLVGIKTCKTKNNNG